MRETIIAEIRRTAAEAGGKAPGRRSFERETGIAESTWRGVYWARWGDALIEAGLKANERQMKFDQEKLMERIAEAFRHFGRVPTLIELRMYGRTRPDFPSHSTLSNHFPIKNDMIATLGEWLKAKPAFGDVLTMLPEPAENPSQRRTAITIKEGSVYLIKSGQYFKVGRSDDAERRFKQISIALPDKAELFHIIQTDDPSGIEAYWHRRFADKRANGEWFKLLASDIAAFKRRKYQ